MNSSINILDFLYSSIFLYCSLTMLFIIFKITLIKIKLLYKYFDLQQNTFNQVQSFVNFNNNLETYFHLPI